MTITVELDDEKSLLLEKAARQLNVDPRELALAAIADLVSRQSTDFEQASKRVLEKNRDLYDRLSK